MKPAPILLATALSLSAVGTTSANTYGSVEPIANPAVIDTRPLRNQGLASARRSPSELLQCGIVDRVIEVLSSTGRHPTVNDLNTHFEVGRGRLRRRHEPRLRLHGHRQRPQRGQPATTSRC